MKPLSLPRGQHKKATIGLPPIYVCSYVLLTFAKLQLHPYLKDDEGEGVSDQVGRDRLHIRPVQVRMLRGKCASLV